MGKINGTSMLVWDNGVVIAAQKGVSINLSQALIDVTTKDSAGWAEHENGLRQADISFDCLVSTTGLSSKELFDHIISRTSLILDIAGLDYPLICEADIATSSVNGPQEEATALTGNFKVKKELYYLSGANANLITDPDAGGHDYDTLTPSGIRISSAINLAGSAACNSNTMTVADGDVIKLIVFLTLNSGQAPSALITSVLAESNTVQLVAGLNVLTLTVVGNAADAVLRLSNSAAGNWSTSNIYLFKVA